MRLFQKIDDLLDSNFTHGPKQWLKELACCYVYLIVRRNVETAIFADAYKTKECVNELYIITNNNGRRLDALNNLVSGQAQSIENLHNKINTINQRLDNLDNYIIKKDRKEFNLEENE